MALGSDYESQEAHADAGSNNGFEPRGAKVNDPLLAQLRPRLVRRRLALPHPPIASPIELVLHRYARSPTVIRRDGTSVYRSTLRRQWASQTKGIKFWPLERELCSTHGY